MKLFCQMLYIKILFVLAFNTNSLNSMAQYITPEPNLNKLCLSNLDFSDFTTMVNTLVNMMKTNSFQKKILEDDRVLDLIIDKYLENKAKIENKSLIIADLMVFVKKVAQKDPQAQSKLDRIRQENAKFLAVNKSFINIRACDLEIVNNMLTYFEDTHKGLIGKLINKLLYHKRFGEILEYFLDL